MTKFNVLLTTYEMLLIEDQILSKIKWRVVAIDEGQKLKNQQSKIFNIAVKMKSDFRILLSGTPLQNNIEELLNLLHFISPIKFNENVNEELKQKFYDSIEDSKTQQIQSEKCNKNENEKVPSSSSKNDNFNIPKKETVQSIKTLLQSHLLRRLKTDVLDNFPRKKEVIIPIH